MHHLPSAFRALELLHALGALDEEGQLTHPLGTNLAKLPVEPTLGKVLLAATEMGCVASALAVVAAASSEKIFVTRRREAAAGAGSVCGEAGPLLLGTLFCRT